MANPTTNYSFAMPTNTDLVKDLPADFEVFGQAVDTQIKTNADAAVVKSTFTTKGDLIAATGASTPARLAVGSDTQVLTADSTAATGMKWAAVAGGSMTSIASGSLSSTSVTISSISGSYKHLYLVVFDPQVSVATGLVYRLNGSSSANYSRLSADYDTSAWSAGSAATYFRPGGANLPTTASTWQCTLFIENYADASSYKNYSGREATSNGSCGSVGFGANNSITAAITSITITTVSGGATFSAGTYILYGVN
jgi:hypothetical protein